jgi:hypothetical protein
LIGVVAGDFDKIAFPYYTCSIAACLALSALCFPLHTKVVVRHRIQRIIKLLTILAYEGFL